MKAISPPGTKEGKAKPKGFVNSLHKGSVRVKLGPREYKIVEALRWYGYKYFAPSMITDIVCKHEKESCKSHRIYDSLKRLVEKGILEKDRRGYYMVKEDLDFLMFLYTRKDRETKMWKAFKNLRLRKGKHNTRSSDAARRSVEPLANGGYPFARPILAADNVRGYTSYGYLKGDKSVVYEVSVLNNLGLISLSYLEPNLVFPFKAGVRGIVVIYDRCATIVTNNGKFYTCNTNLEWRPSSGLIAGLGLEKLGTIYNDLFVEEVTKSWVVNTEALKFLVGRGSYIKMFKRLIGGQWIAVKRLLHDFCHELNIGLENFRRRGQNEET